MKEPEKPKRKRIATKVPKSNYGTNTPVPTTSVAKEITEAEAALYKQAENPLGDPHKI